MNPDFYCTDCTTTNILSQQRLYVANHMMLVIRWDYCFILNTFGETLLQNIQNIVMKYLKQCISSISWDAMCFTLCLFEYFFCNRGEDLTKCTSLLQMFFITEEILKVIFEPTLYKVNTIYGQLVIEKYKCHWQKTFIFLYVWINDQRWTQNPNKHLRCSLLQNS